MTAGRGGVLAWDPPRTARVHLVCLPHAGSGAYQFRSWQKLLGPEVSVLAVQLPGREDRWQEPPATRVDDVVDALVPELLDRLHLPYVVYGHSMGALLGYETALRLGARHGRPPAHFVAAAARAPHEPPEPGGIDGLSDAALVADLIAQGALPERVARDERLIRLVTRPLRGDVTLCESYTPRPGARLPCPLDSWRGADDPGVSRAQAERWSACTTGRTTVRAFPGGHLFHLDDPLPVVDGLRRIAAEALSRDAPAGDRPLSDHRPVDKESR